jgi:L-seryl-tRNA(Ser) seleniumtransferase
LSGEGGELQREGDELRGHGDELRARLRALPAVDRLAAALLARGGDEDRGAGAEDHTERRRPSAAEATAAARAVLGERRGELLAGARDEPDLVERARLRLRRSLRRVLNGTGVVIHTNLGRVPLPERALAALQETARGYANLEYDLHAGARGNRERHVAPLLSELTGAQDALAVNNGAAAVLLAVAALAPARGRVAVSRGQLVEIGGGFRVPEIVAQAGAHMIEVGTTNRTRLSDYRAAVEQQGAGTVLRVHQSNFRTVGFVEEVAIEELVSLGVPVIDDVGSGALAGELPTLEGEPPVRASAAAGAAVVCFSADKLLGGPQAGILIGRGDAIAACRRHPLARAVRIGRLPLAALEATLSLYRDPARALREVPVLAMLEVSPPRLRARAERLAQATGGEIVQATARVGGGALPLLELDGPAVALNAPGVDPGPLARALRRGEPPLIGRIAAGRLLIDPRTLGEEEVEPAAAVIRAARVTPAAAAVATAAAPPAAYDGLAAVDGESD